MSTIEERVKKIVAEQLGVKEEEVTNSASFVEDLGADSLDTVELVMALEEEFETEIKALGFEDSGAEVNIGCFSEKQKFRMKLTDEFEAEDLAEFIEDLRMGKVKPYMKSLPSPKKTRRTCAQDRCG